ncbi:uncharacterized protein HKW66_Vig0083060 [Vigna angularis]|uniref:Uncharacterized protein n=1 Tax=Phaseolus angularis TaxID=3914 RepID=A0A8T0KJJ8_PHAAN|nr:uncharacterized protein HKW66_Vig0083060 [Vigna angularis]
MKADSGGFGCTRRTIGLGIWGYGQRLLLLKATTLKNKGRLFLRCSNWTSNSNCNYFECVDEGESEIEATLQRKTEEVEVCLEKEKVEEVEVCLEKENVVLDLRKKNKKLKRKLEQERKYGKIMLLLFVLSWALTIMFLLKINCN